MTSLVVEGLEEPADSGFIAIEKLLGSATQAAAPLPSSATIHSTVTHPAMIHPTRSLGSEGMD
jgi:hypothetical protein